MNSCRPTIVAGFLAYFTQAVVINLAPLLYVTFRAQFGLSLFQISALIALNFGVQLAVDAVSSRAIVKMGYRVSVVLAHILCAVGLCGYAVLPFCMPAYGGLVLAGVIASLGGGLLEVLVSPIVEACPTPPETKSGVMSVLHSFYSWGQAAVIALSTLYFSLVGISDWRLLVCLWALVPAAGAILFCRVPIYTLPEETEKTGRGSLFRNRAFCLLFVMMLCAGASEMVMSQWASTFVETALGFDKTTGDLLGPLLFALSMGVSRVFYAKMGGRIRLDKYIRYSLILCIGAYVLAAFAQIPALSLAGCALCGLSVGILWPGTYSMASAHPSLRGGGVAMFALLALAGDVGCLSGPALAGSVAGFVGGDLRVSFVFALVFPAAGIAASFLLPKNNRDP